MLRIVFILFAVTYFFSRSSFAQQSMYFGIHQQYMSTRAMGMGNAFSAVADDESAIFYNPAGLPQLTEGKLNMFIKGAADPDILDFADEIDKAGKDTQAIADTVEAHYGENFNLRAPSVGIMYANSKWGVAFIPADVSVDTSVQAGLGPQVNLLAYQDSTLAFSRAWNLHNVRKGRLDVGVTAKLIYRAFLDKVVTVADIQADNVLEKEDSNEGMTADFDIGAMYRLPEYSSGFFHYMQPTLSFVTRNVLDMGYFSNMGLYADDKNGDPAKLHRAMDFGAAFKMPKWSYWTTRWAFEVRDVLHPNWTFKKGMHAGVEFLWEVRPWFQGGWRAGMNQGYWTAGFTGKIWAFKLDLATYGQEVGTKSQATESRVYMFTTSLDF